MEKWFFIFSTFYYVLVPDPRKTGEKHAYSRERRNFSMGGYTCRKQ